MSLILKLLLWVIIWFTVLGMANYLFTQKKLNYAKNSLLFSIIYLLPTGIILLIFKNYLTIFTTPVNVLQVITLFATFTLIIYGYYLIRKKFPTSKKIIKENPHLFFLTMKPKTIIVKSSELFFQQIMIVLLLSFLTSSIKAPSQVIIIFFTIFVGIHLPLIKLFNESIGRFFVVASLIGAIVFPLLILYLNNGFIYSYSIHWLFYLISGIILWKFYETKQTNY